MSFAFHGFKRLKYLSVSRWKIEYLYKNMENVHRLSYKTVITNIHYPYCIVVLNKKFYVTTYHKIICFKYN